MIRQIAFSTCILTLLALAASAQEQRLMIPDAGRRVTEAVPHAGLAGPAPARTPPLMRFAGMMRDYMGRPMTGVHGVSIAIYKDQHGGSPIFLETQSVAFDDEGRFTALMGAASEQGLTPDLFITGEPRWLGVQLQLPGHEEQPRTLLVAVPYAIKALDAETLGGLPASAFVRSDSPTRNERPESPTAVAGGAFPPPLFVDGGGNTGKIAKFTSPSAVGDSVMTESGGNIGIGATSPTFKLSVSSAAVWNNDASGTFAILDSADGNKRLFAGIDPNLGTYGSAFLQAVRSLTSNIPLLLNPGGGNVGIGTTVPQHKLQVGAGTTGVSLGLMGNLAGGPSLVFEAEDGSDRFVIDANTDPITWNDRLSVNAIFTPNVLVLTGDGKVGIGTAAPGQKLDVNGIIKSGSGGFMFPDGTIQTTAAGSLAFGTGKTLVASEESGKDAHAALRAEIDQLRAEIQQLRALLDQERSGRAQR